MNVNDILRGVSLGLVVYGVGCQKIGQGTVDFASAVKDRCDGDKQEYECTFLRAQQLYGDTNGDGRVDVSEAKTFRNKVFAKYRLEQACPFSGFKNPVHASDGSWVKGRVLRSVAMNIEKDFPRRKR